MIQYIYPAVFHKNEDSVIVLLPDLNISTDGNTIEEAYLYAQSYLNAYCLYAKKYEIEIPEPTKYESIADKYDKSLVMLVDTVV